MNSQHKTIWRDSGMKEVWSFYCPVCKAPRKIPNHPRPGKPQQILRIVLTTAFFMLVSWNFFDWKGVVAVFPFWAIYEVFFRLRTRVALRCPHCSFDPFLYAVDADQARLEIEAHYRKVFQDKGVEFPEKPAKITKKVIRGIERVVVTSAAVEVPQPSSEV